MSKIWNKDVETCICQGNGGFFQDCCIDELQCIMIFMVWRCEG